MTAAMEKCQSHWETTYGPQSFKSFDGALDAFFKECPEYSGPRVCLALVRGISSMVTNDFPETTHLRQGQTVWPIMHKDEKGAYGKQIRDTRLQTVVFTLVSSADAVKRANGTKLRDLKIEATARLCKESFEQNGVLTMCVRKGFKTDETAYAVGITSRLVREYEESIEEYRSRNFVLDSLLNYEVEIESQWEQVLQELTNAQ